jgi:hypothetical protein
LLLDERFTDALSTLSPLSDENPDSLPVRGVLGIAYAQADDAEGALAEATWFDNLNTPYLFGEDLYWRAAILAHLGDREEATRTLRRAHDEGFRWSNPSKPLGDIISDPNFRPLWGYEPFQQLIGPKG